MIMSNRDLEQAGFFLPIERHWREAAQHKACRLWAKHVTRRCWELRTLE